MAPSDISAAIVAAAHGAIGTAGFQRAALAALTPIGFDVAFFEVTVASPSIVTTGFDAGLLEAARPRWSVYERELRPVGVAAARDGVAIDGDVLGPRRERLAYFREVVRPQRGTSSLFAHLSLRGRKLGGIMLGRAGTAFGARSAEAVRALLPPLSVGLAATLAAPAPEPSALTPREREVLRLVQLGYTNPEISRALGTSPNTVRNQVSALFFKLGATTRAELVALTVAAP